MALAVTQYSRGTARIRCGDLGEVDPETGIAYAMCACLDHPSAMEANNTTLRLLHRWLGSMRERSADK